MSPLSTAETRQKSLKHRAMLPPLQQAVRDSLMRGCVNASAIRQRTGLPHEKVYEALVWLEARGKAYLVVSKTNSFDIRWGAL